MKIAKPKKPKAPERPKKKILDYETLHGPIDVLHAEEGQSITVAELLAMIPEGLTPSDVIVHWEGTWYWDAGEARVSVQAVRTIEDPKYAEKKAKYDAARVEYEKAKADYEAKMAKFKQIEALAGDLQESE